MLTKTWSEAWRYLFVKVHVHTTGWGEGIRKL